MDITGHKRKIIGFASILVLLMFGGILPSNAASRIAAPQWLPGFPLRAGTSVVIMWTPVPGATGYKLLKKTGDGAFNQIYQGRENSFLDAEAPPNTTIAYKVIALAGKTESNPSPEKTARKIVEVGPPTIVGVIPSEKSITLLWTLPPGAIFSKVYRSIAETGPYTLLDSVQDAVYNDRRVEEGKFYYYKVTAVDALGKESGKSLPLAAKLPGLKEVPTEEKKIIRKVMPIGEFHGEEFYRLDQPSEIRIGSEGNLFVLDRRSIQIFDPDGNFLRRINFEKSWGLASGLSFDRDDNIMLPFFAEQIIRKIDENGKVTDEIRYPFCEEKLPNNPNDITFDAQGNYWIVDGKRSQVIKANRSCDAFDILGRLRGTYAPEDVLVSDFPAAKKIYYNGFDGKIYVLLGATAEIKVIDPKTSKVLRTIGGRGSANDKFQGVNGLAFRKNGNILVLDQFMQVIKEFDGNYNYVATYADIVNKDEIRLSINLATAFALREDLGRFYISSSLGNRVYKFKIAD